MNYSWRNVCSIIEKKCLNLFTALHVVLELTFCAENDARWRYFAQKCAFAVVQRRSFIPKMSRIGKNCSIFQDTEKIFKKMKI